MDKIYPEEHIQAIANAIRRKNGKSVNYLTSEMAGAIDQLVSYPEPTGTQTITENGIVDVKNKAYADVNVEVEFQPEDEGKVVSNGELVAQTGITVTQNGTVDTTLNDEVVVSVSGGGGLYPFMDALASGSLNSFTFGSDTTRAAGAYVTGANLTCESQYFKKFLAKYARYKYGSTKGTSTSGAQLATTIAVDSTILSEPLQTFLARFNELTSAEYYDYVYGSSVITDCGLVLLGNYTRGGASSGNALSDSIKNYSAVVLQGIYSQQSQSMYNTTMVYVAPELNKSYWAGMKDRNSNYDCGVTFTDNTHVSLSGNKQVIIYGMP